jgi:hypothetical protein
MAVANALAFYDTGKQLRLQKSYTVRVVHGVYQPDGS